MKLILWVIFFLAAVASAPFLIGEKGYILISMGNYTIESTVVTLGLSIVILFVLLMFLIKLIKGGVHLSVGSWNKVYFARTRRAKRDFNQGVTAYVLGDYAQAEKLLMKSAARASMENISYVLATDAALKQQNRENAEYYIKCQHDLNLLDTKYYLENVLVVIHQQIQLKNYSQAHELIDQYHQYISKDVRLLGLAIELNLIEERFDNVINYLALARKAKGISDERITEWERKAYSGKIAGIISQQDDTALLNYWYELPKKLKQREAIVLSYCQQLAQHRITEPLNKILLPSLSFNAGESFIKSLRALPLTRTQDLIDQVQKLLHKDPHNIKWLTFLGFLACADKQFDMASKAYASAYNTSPELFDQTDLKFYAQALSEIGELAKANQLLMKALSDKT